MKRILLLLIYFYSFTAYCQSVQELFIKQVITSRFVHEQPLASKLNVKDTSDYITEFIERTGHSIDTAVLLELIEKSQIINANKWSDKELPNSFLITIKKPKPSDSYFYKKYKPATTADTIKLKYFIEQYQELLKEGGGYSYSRPIFDSKGQYALVSVDYGYNLSGRGWTSIYRFSNGIWTELGPIKVWVH